MFWKPKPFASLVEETRATVDFAADAGLEPCAALLPDPLKKGGALH